MGSYQHKKRYRSVSLVFHFRQLAAELGDTTVNIICRHSLPRVWRIICFTAFGDQRRRQMGGDLAKVYVEHPCCIFEHRRKLLDSRVEQPPLSFPGFKIGRGLPIIPKAH